MVKLIWWLIRNIIWGVDFKVDFQYAVNFTEALEYLKKGYFIHEVADCQTYFFTIDGYIFSYNMHNKKLSKIENFNSTFALSSLWYILPMGKQTERDFNNDK